MKYVKLFALALGAVLFTACSEDKYNTASDVTVEMAQADLTVKETDGIINVPLKVTGKANGPISVQIKVEGTGNEAPIPYQDYNGTWKGDYLVTSETLNIPEGETTVSVEISLFDDIIETGDRTLNVSIASCEGATIGTLSTTVVTIADNESLPVYDLIQGAWKFNFLDWDGAAATENVTITGYPEGSKEYNQGILDLEGLLNNPTLLTLYLIEDKANNKYYVEMQLPEPIIWYNASNLIWVIGFDNSINKFLTSDMTIRGEFDKETQTINFNPTDKIGYYIAAPDMSSALGFYDSATQMQFTR